jgi:hypothetical protein
MHRITGGDKSNYKWVSGIPVIGSLFVAISLITYWQTTSIFVTAIILIVMDTGGIHWFLGSILYNNVINKNK